VRGRISMMEETRLLQELEEIAERLSIAVRYDDFIGMDFKVKGGLCKLRGRNFIIMDRRAPIGERIDLLVRVLRRFDLSSVFLRPYIRSIIGESAESQGKGTLENA
jgi:hypothetical protein